MNNALKVIGSLILAVGSIIAIRLINKTVDVWFEKRKEKVSKWV